MTADKEEGKYQADGTIHVRYGSCGNVKSVTFIPLQYVEQSGSKFAVFVPWNESAPSGQEGTGPAEWGLVVKADKSNDAAKGVKLFGAEKFGAPLLHAAAVHVKVTVVVSASRGRVMELALEEIIVPAIPTKPSTA